MLFPIAHAAAINTVEKTSGRQLLTGRAVDVRFLTGRINRRRPGHWDRLGRKHGGLGRSFLRIHKAGQFPHKFSSVPSF